MSNKKLLPPAALLLAFIIGCGPATDEPDYSNAYIVSYTESTIGIISEAGLDEELFEAQKILDSVRNFQQGVTAYTYPRLLNMNCEGEGDEGHTWYLNDPRKKVATGILELFRSADHEGFLGDYDYDWNFHVKPLPQFENLLQIQPAAEHDWSIWAHGVPEGLVPFNGPRLKFEICAPEGLRANPWFFMNDSSTLVGDTISGLGAWVTDGHHILEDDGDTHPELHPVELLWWKKHLSDARNIDMYFMMAMQDASGRFDSGDDYDECDDPWMDSPLRATFKIAFIADTDGVCQNFVIGDIPGLTNKVTTAQESGLRDDQGSGTPLLLKYNEKPLIAVYENQINDDDLGIKFVEVGLRSDGKIQGYVQVKTRIGSGGDDRGYQVLYALKSDAPASELFDTTIFQNELPKPNLPKMNKNIRLVHEQKSQSAVFCKKHLTSATKMKTIRIASHSRRSL